LKRRPTLEAPMVAAEVGFRVDANKPNGEAWRRYWMSPETLKRILDNQ
jgi:hypothetical protein